MVKEGEVRDAVAEVTRIAKYRAKKFEAKYGRVYFRSLRRGGPGRTLLKDVRGWVEGVLGEGGRVLSTCYAWKSGDQGVALGVDENGLENGLHQDRKLFYGLGGVRIVFSLRLDEEDDAESFGFRILRVGRDGSQQWSDFIGIPHRAAFLTRLTSGYAASVKVGGSEFSIYHVRKTGGIAIIVDVIRAENYRKVLRWRAIRFRNSAALHTPWDQPCGHRQHWSMCPRCRPEVRCPCVPAGVYKHKGKCLTCTPSEACPDPEAHGQRQAAGKRSSARVNLERTKSGCLVCSPSQRCECPGKDTLTYRADCVTCSPHLACPHHPREHTRTKCPDYQRAMRGTRSARKEAQWKTQREARED